MVKVQKIFFCEDVEVTQYNKRNFIDTILTKEILIATIPYKFITYIVVIGEYTEEYELTLQISTKKDTFAKIPFRVAVWKKGVINTFAEPIKMVLEIHDTVELFLDVYNQSQLLFSDTYAIILGDAPNTNQQKHLPSSGVFTNSEDIKIIKEIFTLARKSIVVIDNYIRSAFDLRKLLENVIDLNIEMLIFTKSHNKKFIHSDASLSKDFPNLVVFYSTPTQELEFHDRFIIIDKTVYYSFGASLNDISHNKISGYKKITAKREIETINKIIDKLIEDS
jgi:hypothetical protein